MESNREEQGGAGNRQKSIQYDWAEKGKTEWNRVERKRIEKSGAKKNRRAHSRWRSVHIIPNSSMAAIYCMIQLNTNRVELSWINKNGFDWFQGMGFSAFALSHSMGLCSCLVPKLGSMLLPCFWPRVSWLCIVSRQGCRLPSFMNGWVLVHSLCPKAWGIPMLQLHLRALLDGFALIWRPGCRLQPFYQCIGFNAFTLFQCRGVCMFLLPFKAFMDGSSLFQCTGLIIGLFLKQG